MDIAVADVIQNLVINQAAATLGITADEYVRQAALGAAAIRLNLDFAAVIALERQHVETGDYPACGFSWDSGITDPATQKSLTVICCRVGGHVTNAVAARESHTATLPNGGFITIAETPDGPE